MEQFRCHFNIKKMHLSRNRSIGVGSNNKEYYKHNQRTNHFGQFFLPLSLIVFFFKGELLRESPIKSPLNLHIRVQFSPYTDGIFPIQTVHNTCRE